MVVLDPFPCVLCARLCLHVCACVCVIFCVCRDLIPVEWIRLFNPQELQRLIGGEGGRAIDVDDLKQHTLYAGGYHASQPVMQVFYSVCTRSETASWLSVRMCDFVFPMVAVFYAILVSYGIFYQACFICDLFLFFVDCW